MAHSPDETMRERLLQLKADTDLEFMKEFLESAPKQLQEDFMLLSQSIREKNSVNRVFHAHKLKGLLLTIGADESAGISAKIEGLSNVDNEAELRSLCAALETEMKHVTVTLEHLSPTLLHE